jgi:hypothetical protein
LIGLQKHLDNSMDYWRMVMSAELQKVDDQWQATDKGWQVGIL